MAPALKDDKGGKWSSDLVLDLYSNLLAEIWELVSALIGEAILAFLFNLAIRKLGEKHPFLNSLKVSEDGISLDGVREDCRTVAPVEIHRGFQSLINHLSHLFSALAEGVINKELFPKVFPKVKEAERIISQK
ncbi:MAG: hypothetical protein COZ69_04275 [Deltaproteobacteria bacterium CG_4_8_14_3_um_filter_45_9]|jgi:hypothetical protein|nr:MAG: hypothetical protein COS40_15190 [Deltaproteobacteria bacterium CG03_land_8_20_14_0_80_45_14]PIX25081.1 MAG: hypothetical protein COZ69_04275 [Deltaproteobacteria bacterium CG_4_8_14_3_um_filter_45_9]